MAIAEALRARDYVQRDDLLHDPLLGAVRRWLTATPQADRDEILTNLLSRLPSEAADGVRVQFEEDRGPREDPGDAD